MEGHRFAAVLILTICMLELGAGIPQSQCIQPPYTGPCEKYTARYFFDKASHDCKMFIYGGCKGNGNNFRTYKECYGRCGPE
nr:TPA_inf: conotoxin precursor Conkunitzin [Conus ebraeus]